MHRIETPGLETAESIHSATIDEGILVCIGTAWPRMEIASIYEYSVFSVKIKNHL